MRFLSWQLWFFKLLFFPSETVLKMLLTLSSLHMPICCSLQQIPFLATEYSFSVQCVFIYPLSFPLILSRQPSPLFACFTHESLVEFPSHSSLFLEEFATLCHPLKKTFINFVFDSFVQEYMFSDHSHSQIFSYHYSVPVNIPLQVSFLHSCYYFVLDP